MVRRTPELAALAAALARSSPRATNQRLENQVYGLLTHDYYRKLSRTALVNDGLAGAVASLNDPYSHYYDPSNYQNFQDTTTNPQIDGGIGVGIQAFTGGGLLVGEAYPGTPAAKAGIVAGDMILAADGHSFAGRSQNFAVNLIKGKVGTTVTLRVRASPHHPNRPRAAGRHQRPRRLERSCCTTHGVKIGYVDLTQFAENAGAEVRAQVQKMRQEGAQALILDLRDNGGGLLEQAVATASIFIQSGTIVSTDGRSIPRQVYLAKGDAIPASIPLVVLVNRDTASSAEIVTAALQAARPGNARRHPHLRKGRLPGDPAAAQRRCARLHRRRVLHPERREPRRRRQVEDALGRGSPRPGHRPERRGRTAPRISSRSPSASPSPS